MAVVNTKANLISKRDAGAIVAGHLPDASLRQGVATVETLANDSANSVYRFMRVHSSWTIGSIEAFNDALTGGTSYSAGLYDTAERRWSPSACSAPASISARRTPRRSR